MGEYLNCVFQQFIGHLPSFVVGTIMILLVLITYQLIGCGITKNSKGYSYSFSIGFIFFSFFVALIGIPVQLFDLPWKIFLFGMIGIWGLSIIFIAVCIYKKRISINKEKIKKYFSENWHLYVGALIILLFALCHIKTMWENSNTDDGYYLSKMATLPYLESVKYTNPSTGLKYNSIFSYLFNTFELEGSFYLFISKLSVTLYARLFLAYTHYIIILHAVKSIFEKIIDNKDKIIQYVIPFIFLIVVMNPTWFFCSEETWTVSSSVYLGSALARASIVYFALLVLIDRNKLDIKSILFTIMVCVVMISKSSISLPVLFLLAVAYLLVILKWYLKAGLLALVVIAGFILPGSDTFEQHVINTAILYGKNILFLIPLVAGLYFSYKNKLYRKFYMIFIISVGLVLIPEVSDIFETLCQYDFVADRNLYILASALSMVTYTFMVYSAAKLIKKEKYIFHAFRISMLVATIALLAVKADGTNAVYAGYIYLKNMDLTPNNTILLGNSLEDYYEETQDTLYLYTYGGMFDNGFGHFPQQIIRCFSPHTISPVAALRIDEKYVSEDDFNGLTRDDISPLETFTATPNEESIEDLKNLLEKYPFNCIVGMNFTDEHDQYLNSIGFYKYKDVESQSADYTYNIYIKGYNQ